MITNFKFYQTIVFLFKKNVQHKFQYNIKYADTLIF